MVAVLLAAGLAREPDEKTPPTYSEFLAQVEAGRVEKVKLDAGDNSIEVTPRRGDYYKTAYPDNTEHGLVDTLRSAEIPFDVEGKGGSRLWGYLIYVLPFALFLLFWIFIVRRMSGAGGQLARFTKSKARLQTRLDRPPVGFRDVAGVDEAVEELHEIKEFLENPKKFQSLGARIPKGVLLYGPPGTHQFDAPWTGRVTAGTVPGVPRRRVGVLCRRVDVLAAERVAPRPVPDHDVAVLVGCAERRGEPLLCVDLDQLLLGERVAPRSQLDGCATCQGCAVCAVSVVRTHDLPLSALLALVAQCQRVAGRPPVSFALL
jgi:hypothetical protein